MFTNKKNILYKINLSVFVFTKQHVVRDPMTATNSFMELVGVVYDKLYNTGICIQYYEHAKEY